VNRKPRCLLMSAGVAAARVSTYTVRMPTRVTLTTDFGTRDPYVAQLKGVLYAQGPRALEVIDLSHEIDPQNVREAALFVRAAWPRFPPGTIHLVVVDPGVGSTRRALALQHAEQFVVAPDNGVLSLWLAEQPGDPHVVEIDPARLGITQISATFHGRDVFAPVAASLARAVALSELGCAAQGLVELSWPRTERTTYGLRGAIIHIDRFGNLITNITRAELTEHAHVQLAEGDPIALVRCYADAAPNVPVALIGSSELLEIALRDASAQSHFRARVGDLVRVNFG
jgi:S-adenosyl-L-methionine hydrolase (adenosine-forming)